MTEQETRAMEIGKDILDVFQKHGATLPEKAAAMQIVAAMSVFETHEGCEQCEEEEFGSEFPDDHFIRN